MSEKQADIPKDRLTISRIDYREKSALTGRNRAQNAVFPRFLRRNSRIDINFG